MFKYLVTAFMKEKSKHPGVGGRGNRAPYATIHIRIPEALSAEIKTMSATYRELVSEYDDALDPLLINAAICAIADTAELEQFQQQNLELTQKVAALEHELKNLRAHLLSDEFKELTSTILKQSLRLKANSDEETKDKIRAVIARLA